MSLRMAAVSLAAAALAACDTQIQHGLDERGANEIQSVLVERGFDATKVPEGGKKPTWAIEVPEDRATEAVRVLSELGLPRPPSEGFSEVFSKGSLVPTPTEEHALYLQALSGELARTLETVDGVSAARVHVVLPAPPRPGEPREPAKASAYLRVRPGRGADLNAKRGELKALVAGGVDGLSPESVALVIDEVGTAVTPAPAAAAPLRRLRVLVAILGGGVSLLVVALAGVAMWAHQGARRPKAVPAPKPVVATSARKVA